MRSDDKLADIEVQVHHETHAAWLVSTDGDSSHAIWVPKSQCEVERIPNSRFYTLTLPHWLAVKKELI